MNLEASIQLASKSPLPADLVEQCSYHVATRGYAAIPGFLNPEECAVLVAGMERAIEDYRPVAGSERSRLDQYQMHDLMCRDLNFARLLEDPRLQQLLAPHLGDYWVMYAATSSSVPPRGSNYSNRLHIDSPRFQRGYTFNMGLIWTLSEYTESNGTLKVLPGSHHAETVPPEELFEQNCVPVTCPAGTLIVFSARLFHRTGENQTDHWRHSMTLNACRSFMKQRMDWVRFVPDEVASKLNVQGRRLLGFDTRLPASLEELFVPEDQRLYKPNQG